jgi:hypothetical protein
MRSADATARLEQHGNAIQPRVLLRSLGRRDPGRGVKGMGGATAQAKRGKKPWFVPLLLLAALAATAGGVIENNALERTTEHDAQGGCSSRRT